jgi:HK97 family phage major capsid protein/HK97 family phage prohead protease
MPTQSRQASAEVVTRDSEELVEASLASDTPYERDGYREILLCTAKAVNLARARDGLPLLMHHDRREIVGRVHGIRADGRRVRGHLTFFDTEAGREARTMVRAGHRELSVGYQIDESQRNSAGDLIAIRWTLLETSIVAIPADAGIGVARSYTMNEQGNEPGNDAGARDGINGDNPSRAMSRSQRRQASRAEGSERERVEALTRTAQAYAKWTDPRMLTEAIENGWTTDRFNDAIMGRMESRATDATTLAGRAPDDQGQFAGFSLIRAIQAQLNPAHFMRSAGMEVECSRELGRATPLPLAADAFAVPIESIFGAPLKRDMSAGTSGLGGAFVQTSVLGEQLIDALRARSVVVELGARVLPGLQGPVSLPKKTAATASGAWLAETGDANSTDVATGVVALTPKRISAVVILSKQVLMTSAVQGLSNVIGEDLRQTLAHELDRVALNGSGSGNEPRGVRNTSGVGSVVGGANGAQLAWSHVLDLEASVENANAATDPTAMGYAINGKTRSWLKRNLKVSGQPTGLVMGDEPLDATGNGVLNGYRARVSSKLPSNLTKGTANAVCSSLVYGSWAELVVAQFGGQIEIVVDPYTLAHKAQIRVIANLFADIGVRQAASFAVMDDALTA